MKILAIETSCDETALAIVGASGGINPSTGSGPKFKILENLVASQIKIHRPFGGVVPNLAKREHIKNLPILLKKLGGERKVRKADIIAVTVGPGLEPALWTGITFAKELAKKYKKPLIGANHLEGHLYSFLIPQKGRRAVNFKKLFPAVSLIVSGGHTVLLLMRSLENWDTLGETRDDAAGEAFDKVARMLDLPYPGGPEIEKLALRGNREAINFPRPMIYDKNYEFSFSGIKTSVLYYLRDNLKTEKADVAASFEQAVIDVLIAKTIRAAKEFSAKSVTLSGGVAANKLLRKTLKKESKKIGAKFFVPDFKYNLDNAAMIAVAGYMTHLRRSAKGGFASGGKKYKLSAQGDIDI